MLRTESPHVLVVGEHSDALAVMCEALSPRACRCTSAVEPADAVAAVRRAGPDVALIDISGLPPVDGLSVARRLRNETTDLGVVLVARRRSIEDLAEALRIGVVDYLLKPLSIREVTDALGRAFDWRSAMLLARTTSGKTREEMSSAATRLGRVLADAGIATSLALDAYVEALFHSDPTALHHARRVAAISIHIAEVLDIVEPLSGHIERAALLHDIGKLAIPDAVLRKGDPLTSDEYELMRWQVRTAADAVRSVPFLAPAADIILATKEHWDGTGYPRGLRGTAIPVGARIIGVAEAFDSLAAIGAPVAPTSTSVPCAHLVRAAGSRFDPDVVRVWLRCLDDLGANVVRSADPGGNDEDAWTNDDLD